MAFKSFKKAVQRLILAQKNPLYPAPLEIGAVSVEGDIYLGRYTPDGLRKTFNIFVKPENLPQLMNYEDTVAYVAKMENGAPYADEREFRTALANGNYAGEWFIPPLELLNGKPAWVGQRAKPDNLLAHKDKGALRNAFTKKDGLFMTDNPNVYWSSTPMNSDGDAICGLDMSEVEVVTRIKEHYHFSCRLMRMVPLKA